MTVSFNGDVQLTLRVGFDSTGVLSTGFTWTDVSQWMREFDTSYGRTFELDDVSPGTATFTLLNSDRRFDPDSTGGAYAPNVDLRKPVSFQAVHSGTTYNLFYGYVDGWDQTFPGMVDPFVTLSVVDSLSVFGPWETSTTGPQEAAETRIGRLLDSVGWPASLRQLDTGGVTVQAYAPSCANVLGEIRRVTKTEDGLFFSAPDGAATFHTKGHRTGSTSIVTVSDTGGGLPYTNPFRMDHGMGRVRNDWTVVGKGLSPQAAESTASIGSYGRVKGKVFDTLHVNAAAALVTAQGLRDRYAAPQTRIPSVALDAQSDTGLWPHVLGRSLSDRVTVRHATRSATTGVYVADHHVEGVRMSGSVDKDFETVWLLSPAT